jgi:hypothetical protein
LLFNTTTQAHAAAWRGINIALEDAVNCAR